MRYLDTHAADLRERAEALDILFRVSQPGLLDFLLAVPTLPFLNERTPKLIICGFNVYTGKVTWRLYRFWRRPVFGPVAVFAKKRV